MKKFLTTDEVERYCSLNYGKGLRTIRLYQTEGIVECPHIKREDNKVGNGNAVYPFDEIFIKMEIMNFFSRIGQSPLSAKKFILNNKETIEKWKDEVRQ